MAKRTQMPKEKNSDEAFTKLKAYWKGLAR
jgi:hypothetical protein